MTAATSGKTMLLAALGLGAAAAALFGQGVPLPPIGGDGPHLTAAPPPRVPKDEDDKDGKAKLSPPTLGGAPTPGAVVGRAGAAPLPLAAVLVSVDRHFPAIRAAEQDRGIAEGRQTSARGAFDTRVVSDEAFQDGTYDNQRYGVAVLQPIAGLGGSVFGRYRLGSGDYPVYYGERKTAEGGEFSAGLTLPLLRNREIDSIRAGVQRADVDRALVEPNIALARLDAARAASRAYWFWVAAGQRVLIAEDVYRIAETRNAQLGKRVAAGNLPAIEQQDNRRAIVERQARVIVARRSFQQAAIALSLYHRDEAGCPVIPRAGELPALYEPVAPPDEARRQKDLDEAIARRPEVARIQLQREKTLVDLKLAQNQTLPGLSLGLVGKSDVGFGRRSPSSTSRLDRQSAELLLSFDVPVQRRDALGKILSAQGELGRLAAQEQFARDRIQLEVQDAANALENAYDLLQRGKDNRVQAAYLEEAERRLFDVGKSDLFRVNLRELTAAEARSLEIDATAEYYRALADYLAALGIDVTLTK